MSVDASEKSFEALHLIGSIDKIHIHHQPKHKQGEWKKGIMANQNKRSGKRKRSREKPKRHVMTKPSHLLRGTDMKINIVPKANNFKHNNASRPNAIHLRSMSRHSAKAPRPMVKRSF